MDINRVGLPNEFAEAELFGYENGAFISAIQRKLGKTEFTYGRNIFLDDEVSELSLRTHPKLLRIPINFDHEPEDVRSLLIKMTQEKQVYLLKKLFIEIKLKEDDYKPRKTTEVMVIELSNLYSK